jgi:hypothetical protein
MEGMNFNKIICYGCGALVDDIPGEPHKYIGAVQGCWNLYGQILAKEYCEYRYPETIHRLTVDAYSVQHPGKPCRRSTQSVNIHLLSLYLVLEKNMNGKTATRAIRNILSKKINFEWLDPPIPNGTMTIIDVIPAKNYTEHEEKVLEWAKNVWNCWYKKHKEIIEKNVKLFE